MPVIFVRDPEQCLCAYHFIFNSEIPTLNEASEAVVLPADKGAALIF